MTDKINTPIGDFFISCNEKFITSTYFEGEGNIDVKISESNLSLTAKKQLYEYFEGKRKVFELPLFLDGTNFQKSVWQQLLKIPYGVTCSYKDIAIRINNENAMRAVGGANNKNKIGIIIPCHRVIGQNKKLIGYASGVWRKEWLLNLEQQEV